MKVAPTQSLSKFPRRKRAVRAFTVLVLIASVFTATTAQAGPVLVNQVVHTLITNQGPAELRLNTLAQDPKTSTTTGGSRADGPVAQVSSDPKLDALLAGFPTVQDPQKLDVEVVEEAEVEGTICDCGDIFVAAGGFPKWPFLFLAAVPLAFIHTNDCEDCNDSTPTPTPTPTPQPTPFNTPTPTPEPASLILLGTGLMAVGAGLRRRRRNRN